MGKGRAAGLLVVLMILSPLLLGVSGSTPTSPQYTFTRAASPHQETVLGWMIATSVSKAFQSAAAPTASQEEVLAYFDLAERYAEASQATWQARSTGPARTASLPADPVHLRDELNGSEPAVERRIQQQISDALEELDAGWNLPVAGPLFPPVLFKFEPPPKLLVVSPRDRIERVATVLVDARLTPAEVEELESRVAGTSYSTLVTSIGGLGVYPAMLPESSNARWVLRTVAHEWTHHYLALRPLGWRYAFGSETDERMVTLSETVADIVGREVGDLAYTRWYRGATMAPELSPSLGASHYRRVMGDLRIRVDALLSEGKIEEAESAMEETRQELVLRGYSIRKVNQAFFAFHGSYADDPFMAGPEGEDISGRVHALRAESNSLGAFLETVSGVSSYEEFDAAAPRP